MGTSSLAGPGRSSVGGPPARVEGWSREIRGGAGVVGKAAQDAARLALVDPVALPFEGIGGEGEAPARLSLRMEGGPVDRDAGKPPAAEGGDIGDLGDVGASVALRGGPGEGG